MSWLLFFSPLFESSSFARAATAPEEVDEEEEDTWLDTVAESSPFARAATAPEEVDEEEEDPWVDTVAESFVGST